MPEQELTIGELARRTGVATSALRYWEDLGLMPAPSRISGQRRYAPSAIELVGIILVLQEVGFSLRELKALIAPGPALEGWRELAQQKLADLDQRIAHAQAARTAIAHSLACPAEDLLQCPNFASIVAASLAGTPLQNAHRH